MPLNYLFIIKNKKFKLTNKNFKTVLFLFLGFALFGMNAQSVYVNESDGMQTGFNLSEIQSISFEGGSMSVTSTDGVENDFALSNVSALVFSQTISGIEDVLFSQQNNLSIYPNPVSDLLKVDLTKLTNTEDGFISILNVNGQVVQTTPINNNGTLTLDVSRLSNGVYICRYTNQNEIQIVKFIKK
ncbi:MAG: hypothetical protein CR968_02180 [Flavobacteriia bacterium]|nr:MAG: hypothetical protein CR968_02180 [Flavobacteriia bacterium]